MGYNRHAAIHKIGTVIAEEIFDVLKDKKEFNEIRFVRKLLALK